MGKPGYERRDGAIDIYCGELAGVAKYLVEHDGVSRDRDALTLRLTEIASDADSYPPPPWVELSGDEFDGVVAAAVTRELLRNGHSNGTVGVYPTDQAYTANSPREGLSAPNSNGENVLDIRGFSAASAANKEYLKRRPVVEKLAYSESIGLIVGGKHHGKTSNTRTLALAVARGLPIWDRATHQGHVLYVSSEDEYAITSMELERMGWTDSDPLHLVKADPNARVDPEKILAAVVTAALKYNSVLIILDMLFDFAKIKDEMSYAGTRDATGPIQTLATKTKAFVLASHHAPKYMTDVSTAATAALGSQGVAARFSPIILARKWADTLFTIESTMTRDPRGQALPQTVVKMNAGGWAESMGEFKGWMKWLVYAPRMRELFEQAEPGESLTVDAVCRDLEISRPQAQNTLYRLYQEGFLGRVKKGRGMRYWLKSQENLFETKENWGEKF